MKTTTVLGLGLLGFIVLSLITITLAGRWIESDLAERSQQRLEATGIAGIKVNVKGRSVNLSSTEADADAMKQAQEAVEDIWGVRTVRLGTN